MPNREIYRLNKMLAADHEDIGEKTREAAIREFLRIADSFFTVEGGLTLNCERKGKDYAVSLSFRASRVKNVHSLN